MEYEIKSLCPELAEVFTDYMENLDFGHEIRTMKISYLNIVPL